MQAENMQLRIRFLWQTGNAQKGPNSNQTDKQYHPKARVYSAKQTLKLQFLPLSNSLMKRTGSPVEQTGKQKLVLGLPVLLSRAKKNVKRDCITFHAFNLTL
jgi:hypothetical protein